MRARVKCDEACTGCVHDGHKWLSMSPSCQAFHDETHTRWAIEHIERTSATLGEPDGVNTGWPAA